MSAPLEAAKEILVYFWNSFACLRVLVRWLCNLSGLFYLSEFSDADYLLVILPDISLALWLIKTDDGYFVFAMCQTLCEGLMWAIPFDPHRNTMVVILLPLLDKSVIFFFPWQWLCGRWGTWSVESNFLVVTWSRLPSHYIYLLLSSQSWAVSCWCLWSTMELVKLWFLTRVSLGSSPFCTCDGLPDDARAIGVCNKALGLSWVAC